MPYQCPTPPGEKCGLAVDDSKKKSYIDSESVKGSTAVFIRGRNN
jgi:hypothetical protein